MAALLLLHGLATPDIIIGEQPGETNALLALAGGATLPVGGAILALASWPAMLRPEAGPLLRRGPGGPEGGGPPPGLGRRARAPRFPGAPRGHRAPPGARPPLRGRAAPPP